MALKERLKMVDIFLNVEKKLQTKNLELEKIEKSISEKKSELESLKVEVIELKDFINSKFKE